MLDITPVQLSRIENGSSGISAGTLDKAINILGLDPLEAYMRSGLLPESVLQAKVKTIEETLDATLYWDSKGLGEDDKETLRPILEMLDREAERLAKLPKRKGSQKIIDIKDVESEARKTDRRH